MGSQLLKIRESRNSSIGGSGDDNFGDDGFRGGRRVTYTPLSSPIRMQSPVMFEKWVFLKVIKF